MFRIVYCFFPQYLNLIKAKSVFKSSPFFIVILLIGGQLKAQNLFANADFEQLNNCTEYHQDCASEAWFYIKPSATPLFTPSIVPKPYNGKDLLILPIENVYEPQKKRQFVYTMFCCKLQKGKNYKLSFFINTASNTFYGMDFYFQKNEFTSESFSADSIKPSVHISDKDIVNELDGWNYVEKNYTATGDEKFCLLGNLAKEKFDFSPYQRMNKGGDIFYFIDDIAFQPIIPQALCSDYKINATKLYDQNFRHTEQVLVQNKNKIVIDTVTVPAVFFETDKSILKPVFKQLLDSLIINLNKKNVVNIVVEGHTDSKGTLLRNTLLSSQRASAVQKYFLFKMPLLKEIIFTSGKAAALPVANNATEEGRAKNRRVEIILAYTYKSE